MCGGPGRLQVWGRPERQRGGLRIGGPEFVAVPDRLFEVIAEDLRAPGDWVQDSGLYPVGVAVVQVGTKRLGDRAVSRLRDEDVPEAVLLEGPSAGRAALHQALGDEGLEVAAKRCARLGWEQSPDFHLPEVLADDGGSDEDAACSWPQALQPCRQESLNRGRQRRPEVASALLAEGDRQLLQVERVAASGVDEPCPGGRGDVLAGGHRVEQRCGRIPAERRELDADRSVRLGCP